MSPSPTTCLCLSDFNLSNFNAYLANISSHTVHPIETDYGQVMSLLMDHSAECWQHEPEAAFIWTRPEAVSPAFQRLARFESVSTLDILNEVNAFADILLSATADFGCLLVASWTMSVPNRGLGLLNMNPRHGPLAMLLQMNLQLCERLAEDPSTFVLNADGWLAQARRPSFNPKLWYMAKIAYDNEVLKLAAADVVAALRAVRGEARKLVVLDLDNTLWGGVVGDVGWENLVLGGHDAQGEAFADFQVALKSLKNRGIVLALASKNDPTVALDAIDRHPEMILKRDDFAAWRINWYDKAQNIMDLVSELNLGLQSVVFIDDSPAERDRVKQALPDVLVPDWPADVLAYPGALATLSCFDVPTISEEDRDRTLLYQTESKRTAARATVGSIDEWLATLRTTVTLEPLSNANLARAVQLLNKTNQMNLSTRRMTDAEFLEWSSQPQRAVWTVRVEDKFGSMGLTGLLGIEVRDQDLAIVDFVLSCRVFGRKVEDAMLAMAVAQARECGATCVTAQYLPTTKNTPCLDFLRRSGMNERSVGNVFEWDAAEPCLMPDSLHVHATPLSHDLTS